MIKQSIYLSYIIYYTAKNDKVQVRISKQFIVEESALNITAMGETLIDIVIESNHNSTLIPGGSIFNSVLTLTRLGHKTTLLTELGKDHAGQLLINFFQQEGINTHGIYQNPQVQTAIALAFTNENEAVSYVIFKTLQHSTPSTI